MLQYSSIAFAERIFRRPSRTYPYDDIVIGADVRCGHPRMKAVDRNTFRGFYRVRKECPGAAPVFQAFMIEEKMRVIRSLKRIDVRADLDSFSDDLALDVGSRLTNTSRKQLASYNKVRKLIDLYLEHLVALASEFDPSDRDRLVPLLFLPLDSWVMGSPLVFSIADLSRHGLPRRSTYSSVRTKKIYDDLQRVAADRAVSNGQCFPPIYFDVIWSDRYTRTKAGNLFESNPE